MLRIAFTLPPDAAEAAIDELVPLLPRGVHTRELGDGDVELSFYERAEELPPREQLRAAAGVAEWTEETVPDDPRERRRLHGRAWEIAGRLRVRSPDDPPGDGTLPELVIEPAAGAFGTGAHPTTRMCLELLLSIEPGGAFADLGCGAGTLAIAAARLGWEPVLAVDHEPQSVAATRRNAERNGVTVEALELDLMAVAPPPAPTLAANVPPPVHGPLAAAPRARGRPRDRVRLRRVRAARGRRGLRGRRLRAARAARQRLAGDPAGARRMSELLDPVAAAAAAARHGQLASGLPGGGLALSCHKLVEDGARVMMLLAPGLFRLDVRPVEDTLQVMTRSLHEGARWGTEPSAATDYGRKAEQTPEPARADFTFFAELEPRPILARIALTSTVDRERGLTHFVAQAIVREVEPGAVRWRSPA